MFSPYSPNASGQAPNPASIAFMKSGARPYMPNVRSCQCLTITRRRARSSAVRGWMKESPTRSPELGET